MISFIATLLLLITISIIIQLVSKMKIVGGNELGIVSGKRGPKGFSTISGGRVFVIPLFNKFAVMDLTPHTVEVVVDSAIAAGVVPLTVKATVSFAIASSESGRMRAVTRILDMVKNHDNTNNIASSIIEGHLRDVIASMTPEEVMQDKDKLVSMMIDVAKKDLENMGLEITTMNIADVDDHRLPGVDDPDLYIALLKRVQTANADFQARQARAKSEASSFEKQEQRRGETEVRNFQNIYQKIEAETKVEIANQNQKQAIGVEKAMRQAEADLAGLTSKIAAETQYVEMLQKKYEAEVITPALAQKESMILEAKAQSSRFLGTAQGEIDQLKQTIEILNKGGEKARETYIIENFQRLIEPFAKTMSLFDVEKLSILTGVGQSSGPISAIHPNAIDQEKNSLIASAIAGAVSSKSVVKSKSRNKEPVKETNSKREK